MPTNKQKWSQERNWNKKMITGAKSALSMISNQKVATIRECQEIDWAINYLELVIQSWDENNAESKAIYLQRNGDV